jgi:hypothetical protein
MEHVATEVVATPAPRRDSALWRLPWGPIVIIATMVFVAVFAPILTPHSPTEQSLADKLLPPVWQEDGKPKYLLGTDLFGRDLLTRLFHGARVSLTVAAVALLAGGGVGLVIGILSGYVGGRLDRLLMRAVDATLAFPTILIRALARDYLGRRLANGGHRRGTDFMGALCAGGARRGVGHQVARLYRPGTRAWLLAPTHHDGAYPAERPQHLHGVADTAHGVRHHRRGIPQLSWSGYSPAHTLLGPDGGRGTGQARQRVVAVDVPWHCDHARRVSLQPFW